MFWACGRLEPHRERLALRCLDLRGFATYWPQIGGKPKPEALFPGYCFISIALQWSEARWCPGVITLLMNGDEPARVADAVVEELRGREDRSGFVRLAKSRPSGGPRFAPGDQVRIKDGPMRGFVGLVEGMKPHARIEVLLQMLGALQKVELAAAAVERVG
jgi:transcriptional antiterminator RfaH